ncbi:hypothetical protein D3C71_1728330 [compost metagenome]
MALAVLAQHGSVCVDDGERIVAGIVLLLVEADRQNYLQLFRHFLEVVYSLVLLHFRCIHIVIRLLLLAEVRGLEQLLQQDNLGTLRSCFPDEPVRLRDVLFYIGGAAHLRRRYCYFSQVVSLPAV